MRRSIHVLVACVIALALSSGTAWASGGGGGSDPSGSGNCSNAGAGTTGQCSSNNALIQSNVAVVNYGKQENNANQNNQPGGGNSNYQQSEGGTDGGHGGGGSFNCSNAGASTYGQCSSSNQLEQTNVTGVNYGKQENNANQNNQPGGGNSNYQQSEGGNSGGQGEGRGGSGSFNCSNFASSTTDQCKSTNSLSQENTSGDKVLKTDSKGPGEYSRESGDQKNNANQNNQPGGGNTNYQQSREQDNCGCDSKHGEESHKSREQDNCGCDSKHGEESHRSREHDESGGGGSFNCSNFASSTEGQCYSSNTLSQENSGGGVEKTPLGRFEGFERQGDQSNNANQNNQPGGGNSNHQQSYSRLSRWPD